MDAKNSQMPIVSVIVPVYNTEKYLEQCLNSLQNQTLRNIEIIVIDDGSTDCSGSICDLYSVNDSRFKVIHKDNEGLSAARNDGLDMAEGEYIMFVDSDDWVEQDFCELPYSVAVKFSTELVIFQRIWYEGEKRKKQKDFPKDGIASKKDILTDWWTLTGVIVWNKLFHRKLFEEVRFPVGRLSEDTAVTHRLINKANSVYLLNKGLYKHRIKRPGSIISVRSYKLI